MSPEELVADEDAQLAKTVAYYNTFYGTEEGRQVLLDIQRLCNEGGNSAEATVALINLYNEIRLNAGADVTTEKAMIDAEAGAIKIDIRKENE